MKFPQDFIWGAATSSYQIEGAAHRESGGESTWDMLGRQRGKIKHGDTGEFACDHYNLFNKDVALMSEIGLQAYRFSLSWPRVLPDGVGNINQKGLDFYSHLVDKLLENNITPWVTLFHWDFPYQLHCRGGWLNRDSADWFADYTAIMVDKLSDRVSQWITLNEPQCFIGLGYQQGSHAPGLRMGFREVLLAAHHSLLAHGKSVQVIRSRAILKPSISASQVGTISLPLSNSDSDVEAARNHMFSIREKHFFNNTWFSDPMIIGQYPEDGLELFGNDLPEIRSQDLKTINQPLDYYGTNIYTGRYVRALEGGGAEVVDIDNQGVTDMGWSVVPESLYWGPRFFYERYHLPLAVTENGMANNDIVTNNAVDDVKRIEFLSKYLTEYGRAIAEGVPASAYFLWSLMDNFEWAEGYAKRFGIVHVDYASQKRTLKDSAYWYRNVIASNDIPEIKK